MTTDLATIDPATAYSTLVWSQNTRAVLERAFDCTATFTAADIAIAEQIAALVPASVPADNDYVRRAIGSLAGAMPSQATSNEGGKLKLKTYQTMLAGCDQRALAYACRRCLDELDWMPTVHQIKERIGEWVSPEAAAIASARAIVRMGRRVADDDGPVSAGEVRALRERGEAAAGSLAKRRVQPVAYSDPEPLQPHQLRIPNAGDYERLFGIDAETLARKAAAAEDAQAEADRAELEDAMNLQASFARAA